MTTTRTCGRISSVRRLAIIGAASATAVSGAIGLVGVATAAPASGVPRMSCTTMTGGITYQPGLINGSVRRTTAVLNGFLGGCSDFTNSFADEGLINAQLTGETPASGEFLTGSFVINWPPSSHYNPTVGTMMLRKNGTSYTIQGYTSSTTGSFQDGALSASYVVTGRRGQSTRAHPLVAQSFTTSLPVTVSQNSG